MERKRANARLILAAPEMLDLLQRVADNDANFKLDQPDLWAEHQDKIEEDARALLAKLKA
jgi:hypothetical protein